MEKEQFALDAVALYPDKVRLVYHHYPGSDLTYLLDQALEFAAEDGRFWELHDRLVADVPKDESELNELIESMDFDLNKFSEAMENNTYLDLVEQAKAEAEADGISSFGFYINGKLYSGIAGDFIKAVEAAIESVEGGA